MIGKWFGRKKEAAPEEVAEAPEAPEPSPEPEAVVQEVPPPPAAEEAPAEEVRSRWSLFSGALAKTRKGLKSLFTFRRELDDALLDEIEAELLRADFGPEAVKDLVNGPSGIRAAWKAKEIERAEDVRDFLKKRLKELLKKRDTTLRVPPEPPCVILVAGVNGTGKTTSIAKLAKRLGAGGKKVVLAAADTFRAAAVEQLTIWSQRLGVQIVKGEPGADPASVAWRSAEAALAEKADYLIVDTAGRLHTQKNLMRELGKIRAVLGKKLPGSPHESLLVLDATTGQNALNQARVFGEEIEISGIILAKLDGTAKGGIVVAIRDELDIPVKFVGLGEKPDDIQRFDPRRFVDALLS